MRTTGWPFLETGPEAIPPLSGKEARKRASQVVDLTNPTRLHRWRIEHRLNRLRRIARRTHLSVD